jgi:hypothetical protein
MARLDDVLKQASEIAGVDASNPAFVAGYRAGLEQAVKLALVVHSMPSECESLGGMDPETGVSECAMETRGDICLCAERIEEADKIAARIRTELAKVAAAERA